MGTDILQDALEGTVGVSKHGQAGEEKQTGALEGDNPVFDWNWDQAFDQGDGKGTLSTFLGKLASFSDTTCNSKSYDSVVCGASSAIGIEGLKIRITRRLSNVEIAQGASLEERNICLSVHTPLSKILEFISEGTVPVRFDDDAMFDLTYHPSEPWGENDITHPVGSMSIVGVARNEKDGFIPSPVSGIMTLSIGEETMLGRSVSFSDVMRGNDDAIGKETERYADAMIDAFRIHNMRITELMHSNLYSVGIDSGG